jgi:hypothetical protein
MISLPDFKPDDRELLKWVRAVRTAFSRIEGRQVTLRYLAAKAPFDVAIALTSPPVSVHVAQAVNRTDRKIESGLRVTWSWTGVALRIHALGVSDTSDEYDVALWVRE